MTQGTRRGQIVVVAILAVSVGMRFYLFRSEAYETVGLGHVTVSYRWGIAHTLEADRNADGVVDARYVLRNGDPTDMPVESWLDPNFTGCFSIHLLKESGQELRMELDSDCNGTVDHVYVGPQAEDALARLKEPHGPNSSEPAPDTIEHGGVPDSSPTPST